jgi:hypothetical protein
MTFDKMQMPKNCEFRYADLLFDCGSLWCTEIRSFFHLRVANQSWGWPAHGIMEVRKDWNIRSG